MTPKYLKTLEEKIRIKVGKQIINYFSTSLIFILHDKWGWGEVRIDRLIEQVNELYDAIEKGYIDFNDIKKANEEIPKRE